MKYIFGLFIGLLTLSSVKAQTYEIGLIAGGVNYIGDVGATTFINPNTLAFGGIARWNRSTRHSFRGTVMLTKLKADDIDSHESRRNQRGYHFENTLGEVSLGIEYTFWDFDVHSGNQISSPYLFTGINLIGYHSLYKNSNDVITSTGNSVNLGIPMVIGYKATLGRHAIIGAEIGARYTFTDNLDGSNPKNQDANAGIHAFGNINNNDWYLFTGINITFTFGRKPCYCNF